MSVNMKAVITYDCKCDYCGRSLTSLLGSYEQKPTSKRELNRIAHSCGWFHDNDLDKNVCTDKRCVIKWRQELGLDAEG